MSDLNIRRTLLGGLQPNEYQTDIAHMVYFAKRGLPFNSLRSDGHPAQFKKDRVDPPDFCKIRSFRDVAECKSDFYYSSLFDSFISTDTPPQHVADAMLASAIAITPSAYSSKLPTAYIESLTLCPRPNELSTGSHRVVAVFWMSGERFAAVFEEGGDMLNPKRENVFIDGLTPGADEMVRNLKFDQTVLIPSIVYAMTGYELYPPAHQFSIQIYDPALPEKDPTHTGHWFEGCRPSKDMYHY
ncbi:MAG: hypothetical protein HN337_04565 [Deltaproteobacteria bacterium]|jgi:hypothetical protein|nr:hypothetical protein [Deltaproteobacteria bacterium]